MGTLNKRHKRCWYYIINQLKTKFSPGVPVYVKTVPLDDSSLAMCKGVIKLGRLIEIVIKINNKTSWLVRRDSLFHEWAHAMEWEAHWYDDGPKKEHGETWGVWYAKIYKHIMDDSWEDMKEKGLVISVE